MGGGYRDPMGSGVKPEIDPQRFAVHRSTVRGFEQAFVYEDIDVSAYIEELNQGANVLAIHGLNLSAGSDDFLILPELLKPS